MQFTATPFREDGKPLGGRLVYDFPLAEAQKDGYFSPIRYQSVFDLEHPDQAIATAALTVLREDLAAGYDHLLMARVSTVPRAVAIAEIYRELGPDLGVAEIHSGVNKQARTLGHEQIANRSARILVCVDMLGEGYDLRELKVAALHDPRRSLGPTLQFIGRFARAGANVGHATAVATRSEQLLDRRLRRLYGETAAWDDLIEELSSAAVAEQQRVSDFEAGFPPDESRIVTRSIAPTMSAVVYRTFCDDWAPENLEAAYSTEALMTRPIPVNAAAQVLWFVIQTRTELPWTDEQLIEDVSHTLFVCYWDATRGLLYINGSSSDGVFKEVAERLCGADCRLIKDDDVYRAFAGLARPVPTNVGVLDIYNRSRRFSMFAGANVSEGFPTAEEATKFQTNVFAVGFSRRSTRKRRRQSQGSDLELPPGPKHRAVGYLVRQARYPAARYGGRRI